jgi:hypothetical protein
MNITEILNVMPIHNIYTLENLIWDIDCKGNRLNRNERSDVYDFRHTYVAKIYIYYRRVKNKKINTNIHNEDCFYIG